MEDCAAERTVDGLEEELRIIAGLVPEYERTSRVRVETPQSRPFRGRLVHVHSESVETRDAVQSGGFGSTFEFAARDSLDLRAVTMTGPTGGFTGNRRPSNYPS